MGQGADKIAKSLLDLQPTIVMEFFRVYPDVLNKPDFYIPFHNGSVFEDGVFWQNTEYIPMPVEMEGFEVSANNKITRPKIRIANKDNLITSILMNNDDFKNARFVRKRTFIKYLDDVNFDGGNPYGNQDFNAEISSEEYVVSQKLSENRVYVEFELTNPLDLDSFEVNTRKILAKYCYWQYRGQGCNYNGLPIEKPDGNSFSVAPKQPTASTIPNSYRWSITQSYTAGQIVYLENPKILVNQLDGSPAIPLKTWYVCKSSHTNKDPNSETSYWEIDGCSKQLGSCQKRFNTSTNYTFVNNTEFKTGYSMTNSNGDDSYKMSTTHPKILNAINTNSFSMVGWYSLADVQTLGGIFQTSNTILNRSGSFNIYSFEGNVRAEVPMMGRYVPGFSQQYYAGGWNYNFGIGHVFNTLNFIELHVTKSLSSPHNYSRYSELFKESSSNNYWKNDYTNVSTGATSFYLDPTGGYTASYISPVSGSLDNSISNTHSFLDSFNEDVDHQLPNYAFYKQPTVVSFYVKPSGFPYLCVTANYIDFNLQGVAEYNRFGAKVGYKNPADYRTFIFSLTGDGAIVNLNGTSVIPSSPVETTITRVNNNYYRVSLSQAVNTVSTNEFSKGFVGISITPLTKKATSSAPDYANITFPNSPIDSYSSYLNGVDFWTNSLKYPINYYSTGAAGQSPYKGTGGYFLWGMQIEKGILPSAYTGIFLNKKTTNKAYLHPNYDIDGKDQVRIYVNGKLSLDMYSKSCSIDTLTDFKAQEFAVGAATYINVGVGYKGELSSWMLWDRNLTEYERSFLYKSPTKLNILQSKNDSLFYPRQFNECVNQFSSLTGSSLLGWWELDIGTTNTLYDKSRNQAHLTAVKNMVIYKRVYKQDTETIVQKYTSNSNLPFGGFPAVDNFSYGGF